MPRILILLAALCAAAVFAGCSSGDDGSTASPTRTQAPVSLAPIGPQPEPVQALDETPAAPQDGALVLSVQNVVFAPNYFVVPLGGQVTIRLKNSDNQTHDLRIAGPDGQYNTEDDTVTEPSAIPAGESGEVTFAPLVAGSYTFRCDFHPGSMGGQIKVVPDSGGQGQAPTPTPAASPSS